MRQNQIPQIIKVKKSLFPFDFQLNDKNEAEGPYESIFDLKKRSLIFSSVKLQKHKERVLKNKNINEVKDLILTQPDLTYDAEFFRALHHTMVGKISRQKVKGVHFFDPENIRIIEKISTNRNGVYSARIEKYSVKTSSWIEKEEITNFFPDEWSINQLFHECFDAYSNKKHINGNVYKSSTISGIPVKFVINQDGNILTLFPEIENE